MGGKQSAPRKIITKKEMQTRELSPIEKWNQSEKTQDDFTTLLETGSNWNDVSTAVITHLRTINNRDKYQHYASILLNYFKRDDSNHNLQQTEQKQLFTFYFQKLAHSYFMAEDFHETGIASTLSSKQKLLFLYDYYSLNEPQLEKAIFFNYPSIFTEFKQFTSDLIDREIILRTPQQFLSLLLPLHKIHIIKQNIEEMNKYQTKPQQLKTLEQLQQTHELKRIYLSSALEFAKYDNADMTGTILKELSNKGYDLNEQDYQYHLKIQLYALFLYQMGKLTLNFKEFQTKTVNSIIQLFYENKNIEDTPLLAHCFEVFGKYANEKKSYYLLEYCLHTDTHLSQLIRLLEHQYIELKRNKQQFAGILNKVINSRCEIGRYADLLLKLTEDFIVDQPNKDKFVKLIKTVQCLHTLGENIAVEEIYPTLSTDPNEIAGEHLLLYQEGALNLFKTMINGFFKQTETITKTVLINNQKYSFSTLYDLLNFLSFARSYIANNCITETAVHQLVFNALIKYEYYQEIGVLLNQQNRTTYRISFETIEMLIIDHLINLFTTKRIKSIEETAQLLTSIIGIPLKNQPNHFIAAYYRYFKYLQDKDLTLTTELKKEPSIKHFYHLTVNHTNKLENIDFDYLYTQLSCIQEQYTDTNTIFAPNITEEFLKFKVYLCNQCFSLKKIKLGNQIIENVMQYEPPWLSNDLVQILRNNPNIDESFINIAFVHCSKGEDLRFIIAQHLKKQPNKQQKLSLKSLKKLNELIKQEKYICLDNDIVLNQTEYGNLVAEMTFSKPQQFINEYRLFFKLLSTEPQRAFHYATNYCKDITFINNFLMQAVRRNIIHITNILPLLTRYLHFKLEKQLRDHTYIKYKEYLNLELKNIITNSQQWNRKPSSNIEVLTLLTKTIKNYEASLETTPDFLQLYVSQSQQYRFVYDELERKRILLEIRQQPMSKNNVKVFQQLCQKASVDILELSLYELFGRVNSKQQLDEQSWNIVQKLIFWTDSKSTALTILKKLCSKIQMLQTLLKILEFIRLNQNYFKEIVTNEHLEIISSLAAVEQDKNLYGIIPNHFFERNIGVYPTHPKGILSETHRKILEQSGSLSNIFVLSKALYFMYGCDQQIEKVILGEFSLKQQDSESFEVLRKKIKLDCE